jgi:hypothetical protein
MPKVYFIAFVGGSLEYLEALSRIISQAKKLGIFDKVIGYTPIFLINDKKFWNEHGDFIKNNTRGFGYWIWKPYLIKKTLELLDDGDILMYADAGCELDYRNKKKILELIDISKKDKLIGSIACGKKYPCIEKDWTKMDTFIQLDATDSKYIDTPQRQASAIIIYKCKETVKLVDEWFKYVTINNYHLVDDTPSKATNFETFKENRHDQSIFSILTKKMNLFSNHVINPAVYISRNRTGKSKIY